MYTTAAGFSTKSRASRRCNGGSSMRPASSSLPGAIWGENLEPKIPGLLETRAKSNISGASRRALDLQQLRQAGDDRPAKGRRALPVSFAVRELSRARDDLLLHLRTAGLPDADRRPFALCHRPRRIISEISWTRPTSAFASSPGDQNLSGGVREFQGEESYQALVREGSATFNNADISETIRFLDKISIPPPIRCVRCSRTSSARSSVKFCAPTLNDAEVAVPSTLRTERPADALRGPALACRNPRLPQGRRVALTNSLCAEFEKLPPELERIKTLLEEAQADTLT